MQMKGVKLLAPEKGNKAWSDVVTFPLPGRSPKPRKSGITMIIDKGLGLAETEDLLNLAADYIDYIKLGFGTSALYSEKLLRDKIRLVKAYEVDIYPGGTFFEIAFSQNKFESYLQRADNLGFTTLELSDGTIEISDEVREYIVRKARAYGFKIITEVGKKRPEKNLSSGQIACYANMDLANGADWVIVEGRESGKGIGVFDNNGLVKKDTVDDIVRGLKDPSRVIWEAPLKDQQEKLISRFGPDVSLGNIQPYEILALESLRVGLRADTLQIALNREQTKPYKTLLNIPLLMPEPGKT